MNFKKWLEDAGQVFSQINGDEFAKRGIRSKISANDAVMVPTQNLAAKLFGKMKRMKKK